MQKPVVYLGSNKVAAKVKNELAALLVEKNYEVIDFKKIEDDHVENAYLIGQEVLKDKNHRVAILICNTGRSMKGATEDIEAVNNLLINQDTNLETAKLGTANLISLGVREFSKEEINNLALAFLKQWEEKNDD